jgi:bacterioferritin
MALPRLTEESTISDQSFSIDVTAIRERARQKMAEGPVTDSYGLKADEVVAVLNEVLATEIVCWMRYARHAISVTGINRAQVAAEFTEHADQEREHAMRAAERISQLGGEAANLVGVATALSKSPLSAPPQ